MRGKKNVWRKKKTAGMFSIFRKWSPVRYSPVYWNSQRLKKRGVKIALGSASKNAALILERLKLGDYFEVIVDGTLVTRAKPDPEVFVLAADKLGLLPWECIVFEDAVARIEAAQRGGMEVIGVGNANLRKLVPHFLNGLHEFRPDQFFVDQRW